MTPEVLGRSHRDEGYMIDALQQKSDPQVGYLMVASQPIHAGTVVVMIDLRVADGRITTVPSKYTIQISVDRHVENAPTHASGMWHLMNHMEIPNLRIELTPEFMKFVACQDIQSGEELGFNYSTTEWSMVSPFLCSRTGTSVQGFRHLTPAEQARLLNAGLVTHHIKNLWIEEGKR